MDLTFYKGKNILVTGHTGFKGAWLCKILIKLGANVTGYSLAPQTIPDLFSISEISDQMESIIGDIRDFDKLKEVFQEVKPEIVFHLAAQPIVRTSYTEPLYTYETNVIGTANLLECVRLTSSVKSFVNVTTDKVYENKEWEWGYRENENLDGYDPYSNSKSCSELVTASYKRSFFDEKGIAVSTVRAGNVIGGGDFSEDRIIPDCIRAIIKKKNVILRNPNSIRPYQHVLEPLHAYLYIAMMQYKNIQFAGSYNIGPDESDCVTTGFLVESFCRKWNGNLQWEIQEIKNAVHEANYLKLDCSKIKTVLGWHPIWSISEALDKVVEWTEIFLKGQSVSDIMYKQIDEYENRLNF